VYLNGPHRILVYAYDNNILYGSVRTSYYNEKKTETLAVGNMEMGIKANADKTRYMVMSRDQNAVII